MNKIVCLLLAIILLACEKTHIEAFDEFNKARRYPRFKNTKLIIGNVLNEEHKKLLTLDTIEAQIYSISAQKLYLDLGVISYYMYGISREDSILSEVRIKSFKKDQEIGEFQIIDFDKDKKLVYDYWIDGATLTVKAMNEKGQSHYTYYKYHKGKMLNTNSIPDTIFRRHDLYPEIGRRVRIYDDFVEKLLQIGNEKVQLEGEIVQCFRGEDCKNYMIVALDKKMGDYHFVLADCQMTRMTSVAGIKTDSLVEGKEACLKTSTKPFSTPKLIHKQVYIDYKR